MCQDDLLILAQPSPEESIQYWPADDDDNDLSLHCSPLTDRNQGTSLCAHCLLTVSKACWTSDAAGLSCYDMNFESLTYTLGETIFGELYLKMIG